jgi:hypothetical protein
LLRGDVDDAGDGGDGGGGQVRVGDSFVDAVADFLLGAVMGGGFEEEKQEQGIEEDSVVKRESPKLPVEDSPVRSLPELQLLAEAEKVPETASDVARPRVESSLEAVEEVLVEGPVEAKGMGELVLEREGTPVMPMGRKVPLGPKDIIRVEVCFGNNPCLR